MANSVRQPSVGMEHVADLHDFPEPARDACQTSAGEVDRGPGVTSSSIQQEFEASVRVEIRAVYGVYLLETREVWAPRLNEAEGIGLLAAPRDLAGFADLGNAAVQSDRIASFLKPKG